MMSKSGVFVLLILTWTITLTKSAPKPQEVVNDHKIDQQMQEPQSLTFDLNPDGQYIVTRRKRSVFIAPLIAFCKNGQVIDPAGSGKCVTPFQEYEVNPEYLLQQLNNLSLSHVRKNTTTVKTNNFKKHLSSLIQLYWA